MEVLEAAKVNSLEIGDRIKMLRSNQKRTLQEIADSCELSRSMISKIENNKTIPSVATLVKIANSLGTTISSLLEHNEFLTAILTTREKAVENTTLTDKGYAIFPYASEYHEKKCSHFYLLQKRVK